MFSDLTRVGFIGKETPARAGKFSKSWRKRATPPSAACHCAYDKEPLQGWEVDQAARDVIDQAGYGEVILSSHGSLHRPGDAGNLALSMDDLETHEERASAAADMLFHRAGHLPAGIRRCGVVNVFIGSRQGRRHRRRSADGK